MHTQFNWDARAYFAGLTESNRLARRLGMEYRDVSGLQGFEDVLATMQDTEGFVALADSSDGVARIDNSPNTRRVKTIFLGLRHAAGDMEARASALADCRELFRQFLSHLLREQTRLHQLGIYLDPEIAFHEISEYFATGAACAYFQVGYSTSFDLRYNPDQWQ